MSRAWQAVVDRKWLSTGVGLVVVVLLATAVVAILRPGDSNGNPTQAGVVYGGVPAPLTPTDTSGPRPNIILISTDDETLTDMKYMAKTRHIFGDGGMRFTNMYSPHPLCCPARAEILTGEYAQNNGVHSNSGKYGGYPSLRDPNNSIGAWLQRRGYTTAMLGKFLNVWSPSKHIPEGWNYWQTSIKSSFGYYGYHMDVNGKNVTYPPSGPYSTDLVNSVTDRLIDQYSSEKKPFFIWSSYYAPHGLCGEQRGCKNPPEPAHKYAHYQVKGTPIPETKPSFNEKNVSDKPSIIRKLPYLPKKFATYSFDQRIRSLQSVDDAVQRTMQTLKKDHVEGNTYLLFTSDNGFLIGEHRYLGKILPYDESLRVPLYARGPGIKAGSVENRPVTTVDLASTIADIAGATPEREQDGESLLPVFHGGAAPKRNAILIQAGGLGNGPHVKPWLYRGLRTSRYTFARYFLNGVFNELYDDKRDPYQLNNLAYEPRYKNVVHALQARLDQLTSCKGTDCNRTFAQLPKPKAPTKKNTTSRFPRGNGKYQVEPGY